MTTKKSTTRRTVTVEKRVSKFAEILSRSNGDIRADRAMRIANAVEDAQQKLIMDLNSEIRKKENELDSMLDLSTSNVSTSMNVVSPDFDADSYVRKINNLHVEIELKVRELEIAKAVKEDLF